MEVHGYKYAFMTTYEWTVFLKREPFTFDEAFATANNTGGLFLAFQTSTSLRNAVKSI